MDRELSVTDDGCWEAEEARNQRLMQFEKGYLWEVALSKAFGEKAAERPREFIRDGIAMNPDGVIYHFQRNLVEEEYTYPVVEEYKCTACSSDKSPADNWKWMMQVKGYCKALGATKCIFRILHVRSFVPEYNVWELTFTQVELDENWQAVLNHVKVMKGRE